MGSSRFDPKAYASYSADTAHYTTASYNTAATRARKASVDPRTSFNPKIIKVRESTKSDLNPHPTPVIVGLDVSGSMGVVVEACRKGLGTLFEEIIKRDPVSDPHVLAMAIGDMDYDYNPVQATQFEADPVTIGKQVEDLELEGGGGGNSHESYLGPLYFALMRTKCDAFSEGRKGYIFTVGDEQPQFDLTQNQIDKWFGDQPKKGMTAQELLAAVERNWHVFHIMIAEGSHARSYGDVVRKEWTSLLGQRAIWLSDHTKMAEIIISTIEVTQGRDKDKVASSWSGDTSLVVADAIAGLPTAPGHAGAGPVAL